MEDIKQIQEFFSKPLEENTFKKGDKVIYLGNPAEITFVGKDQMGRVYYSVSYDKGNGKTKASNLYNKGGEIKPLDEGNDKIKDLEQLFDFHTQMDNKGRASVIKDKIEKLRKLSNSGEIDGDEFLDKFNPLSKELKSLDEGNSYARVSMPRFVKDKNIEESVNEAEYYGVDRDTEMRAAGIGGSTNYMPWKNATGFTAAVKKYVEPADIQSLSTSRVITKPGSKTFMTFFAKDGFDMDQVVKTITPGLERMSKVRGLHFLIQKIDANSFSLSAKKPDGTFTDDRGKELNIDKSSKYYIKESVNEELNLSNYGKVTPPKGGASLIGKYNSIQGKSKYDTVIFDYQEGSDKPYGIVQVEGHGIYGSDLLKRLGLRQTKSWTTGVDVYIHDGNNTPVYVSEDDFKALLDLWSGGLDREAKAQADFYRGRGNTSGTIDENLNPEVSKAVNRFIKAMAKRYDYSEQDAVYAVMSALRKENFQGLNEMDLNDPVMMKMRAAKDKLAKMRAANAGDDGNDKFFAKNAERLRKLKALKGKRAQIMRDMDQEAEPEGGPIADKYGDMLNKIDKAISMLQPPGEKGNEYMSKDEIERRAAMISVNEVTRYSGFTRNPKDPDSEPFNPTGSVAEFREDLRALFGKFKGDLKNPEFIKGVAEIMVNWKSLLRSQLDEAYIVTYAKNKGEKPASAAYKLRGSALAFMRDLEKDGYITMLTQKPVDGVDESIAEASKEEENEFHKELDKLVHKTFGHSSDEKKKSMAQELAETIKLGEGVIEEKLCPKGKAYIKRRKAAGEKSSAYLSGRAVKVCKGQMSGRKKKK